MTLLKEYGRLLRQHWYVLAIALPASLIMGMAFVDVFGDGWMASVLSFAFGVGITISGLQANQRRLDRREWDRKLREARAQWEHMLDNDEPRDY